MTTYGYARVSSVGQLDGSSLAEQERRIKGRAMACGLLEPIVFRDEGVSGGVAVTSRPEGAKLVKLLQRGDLLIVAKMDRLFRNASDALATADAFQREGVDLVICDMGDEPVTRDGTAKLFFGMLACFAEFERGRIAERVTEGKRAKAVAGGHTGGHAPYGFKILGRGREARLVKDAAEQRIVAEALELAQQGLSPRVISERLAEAGVLSRVGRPLHATQVARMIHPREPSDGLVAA